MKLGKICWYIGLLSGGVAGLLILGGIIGFFTGPFVTVENYWNFFWGAQFFFLAGIFCVLVYKTCEKKEDKPY